METRVTVLSHLYRSINPRFNLQIFTAILTWLIIFGISLELLWRANESVAIYSEVIIGCLIGYLVCFLVAISNDNHHLQAKLKPMFFGGQLLFSFVLLMIFPQPFLPILTIIWSAVSLSYFRPVVAIVITTVVVIVWFGIYSVVRGEQNVMYSALLYYSFHLFALMMSIQTRRAEQSSEYATALNIELQATRELLSESSKIQERTRIARELHDLLGHHLTALNINLQVASHHVNNGSDIGMLKEPVEQSYLLSKLLLSDVREAVSVIRQNTYVDISKALASIQAAFPKLKIEIEGEIIESDNIDLMHDLLRCIQEAVTNAVKHGAAKNIKIVFEQHDKVYWVSVINDGNVVNHIKAGNGYMGMQERMKAHGGQFELTSTHASTCARFEIPNGSLVLMADPHQMEVG